MRAQKEVIMVRNPNSDAAWDSMQGEPRRTVRQQVLDLLERQPLATWEMEERLGRLHQTVSATVNGLWNEGLLVVVGTNRTPSGRQADIYALASKAAVSPPPASPQSPQEPRSAPEPQPVLFESIPDPEPSQRPQDYRCGHRKRPSAKNPNPEPCLQPFGALFTVYPDARYAEGHCATHGREIGSLARDRGLPVGHRQR
jgi:hypothetical protein